MKDWSWKLIVCFLFLVFGLAEGSIIVVILAVGWYILALCEFNEEHDSEDV